MYECGGVDFRLTTHNTHIYIFYVFLPFTTPPPYSTQTPVFIRWEDFNFWFWMLHILVMDLLYLHHVAVRRAFTRLCEFQVGSSSQRNSLPVLSLYFVTTSGGIA